MVCLLLTHRHTKRYVCMVEPNQENYTECSFYRDPEHHRRHRVSRRMEASYAMMPCSEVDEKSTP